MTISRAKLVIIDTFLLLVSFFLAGYIKFDQFDLPQAYVRLFYLFAGCWLVSSFVAKKFQVQSFPSFRAGLSCLVISMLYLGYCLAFVLVMFGLEFYSRYFIVSVCFTFLGLELLVWAGVHGRVQQFSSPSAEDDPGDQRACSRNIGGVAYWAVTVDGMLLYTAFMAMNYIKRGHFNFLAGYDKLLLIMVGLWFLVSICTRKFFLKAHKNVYFCLWQWLKSVGLMMALLAVLIYGFDLFYYSRAHAFGTILILMVFESILLGFYFAVGRRVGQKKDIETVAQVRQRIFQEPISMDIDFDAVRKRLMSPARKRIQGRIDPNFPGVSEFLDNHLDLNDIKNIETRIVSNGEVFQTDQDAHPVKLLLYKHKLNNIRRLNLFFLGVHQFLVPGGYFVGYGHTIATHRDWMFKKFPRQIATFVYGIDFLINRIMPKLPGIKQVYFASTRGKNRVISRAEFLGRLCFCGFEIVATSDLDKRFWIIARKVKTPSFDRNPTYGPLVGLPRSGKGDSNITVYKFRTMHPYSEYLQQYLHDHNGLQKGGKIENDFRMTAWGKFMRKFWLDELPMLYNWLRGDLQIVGVRPLSRHFLSLYDQDLRDLRKLVRPGLVPPFYADLPETFEEICESERRYIKAVLKHPLKTQVRYFFTSFVNIVFKGARSK